MTTALVGQS